MLRSFVTNAFTKSTKNTLKRKTFTPRSGAPERRIRNDLAFNLNQQNRGHRPLTRMPRQWVPRMVPRNPRNPIPQQFRLVSYNILAQDLLEDHLFLYANNDHRNLGWQHRLQRLKEEITRLRPDVLCLQEMQYNHLKTLVKLISGDRKMEYLFKKRTGNRTDGCAIVYDKSKFKILDNRIVEYHTPGIRTLDRENVALLAKFSLREDAGKRLVVATTHLLYNPKRDDVRISQIEMLMTALNEFSRHKDHSLPVILTGDFNSEPYSQPYALLTKTTSFSGGDNPALQAFSDRQLGGESSGGSGSSGSSSGSGGSGSCDRLQLRSLDFGRGTATTFQDRWITVDYILQSIAKENHPDVQVNSVYQLLNKDECEAAGHIPNTELGSDHYCLAINFTVN